MDVLANNLANVNTTAFKPIEVVLGERARAPESVQSSTNSRRLLEQLGGGTRIAYSGINLSQGSVEATSVKTDLALEGQGFVRLEDTKDGAKALTRDGRLYFDDSGVLRHRASNRAVLNENAKPIQLDDEEQLRFEGFRSDGALIDRTDPVKPLAMLGLVNAPEKSLKLDGRNILETKADLKDASDVRVRGGALESSTADPVTGMVQIIKLTRDIEMNSRMIQYQDAMIGQAVTALGRVV